MTSVVGHREKAGKKSPAAGIRTPSRLHWWDMRNQQVLDAPPMRAVVPTTLSAVMTASLFGEPVRGRVLLAVGDQWVEELLTMLPFAERHVGDVHFVPTSDGPGLRPCSMGLLVLDPALARLESLRPALVRGGALAEIGADGRVRWTKDTAVPREIGRLRGGRR